MYFVCFESVCVGATLISTTAKQNGSAQIGDDSKVRASVCAKVKVKAEHDPESHHRCKIRLCVDFEVRLGMKSIKLESSK